MQKTVEAPLDLLQSLSSVDPCQYDCNGDCQAHMYFGLAEDGEVCPQAALRELIAKATAVPPPPFVEFT